MKRILSGIKASGSVHLGNYLGALKPWAALQGQGETLYFIPDLHTLNTRPQPSELRDTTLETTAWMIASGLDPSKSIIFKQSDISAHAELSTILSNYVTMGELSRMTQYKDQSAKRGAEGQLVGLFTYPVLMAADILLYDTSEVPVGEDQKQHVELTRDIATRFNNLYGDVLTVPSPNIGRVASRVMSLQDPMIKMSKSDADQSGYILLLDDSETIKAKISRAVTDSGSEVELSDDKPAISNLLQIYSGITERDIESIVTEYSGKGYGEFKQGLATVLAESLGPIRQRYLDLMGDSGQLTSILKAGAVQANTIADRKLEQIKQVIGLS